MICHAGLLAGQGQRRAGFKTLRTSYSSEAQKSRSQSQIKGLAKLPEEKYRAYIWCVWQLQVHLACLKPQPRKKRLFGCSYKSTKMMQIEYFSPWWIASPNSATGWRGFKIWGLHGRSDMSIKWELPWEQYSIIVKVNSSDVLGAVGNRDRRCDRSYCAQYLGRSSGTRFLEVASRMGLWTARRLRRKVWKKSTLLSCSAGRRSGRVQLCWRRRHQSIMAVPCQKLWFTCSEGG